MRYPIRFLLAAFLVVGPGWAQARQGPVDLTTLSLEELLAVGISAAAKDDQTLGEAPASVTVVTRADLERWGCHTLGEVVQRLRGF